MDELVTVLILVGDGMADSEVERWVRGACLAAADDLVVQLQGLAGVGSIVVATPERERFASLGVVLLETEPGPLHVGRFLAQVVPELGAQRLLVLGGGSVPLITDVLLAEVMARLRQADSLVVTNNRYSSDWAGIVPASSLIPHQERLPRDNMLGWVLSTEAGLPCHALAASAATRLDIDTPTDLMALALHPATKPYLRRFLAGLHLPLDRWQQALELLRIPAKEVFIAGRIAPAVWQVLNNRTHCWFRVLAEERGMVSSGREERGEVFSLFADYLDKVGSEAFFAGISRWADLALFDTRVLLAHHQLHPSAADRFAADLGLVDQIQEPWLRAFTMAAQAAPIPVLCGGHSLMAGDLLALADLLEANSGIG